MRKIVVRRLGVASVARFIGVAHAIWGVAVGFLAMFAGISAVLVQEKWNLFEKILGSIGMVLLCLVVVPIVAFLFGWLYGAVLSLIANLFLHTANGVEFDVDDEE